MAIIYNNPILVGTNSLLTQELPYSPKGYNAGDLTKFNHALPLQHPAVAAQSATLKTKLSRLKSPEDALKAHLNHSNNGAVFAK